MYLTPRKMRGIYCGYFVRMNLTPRKMREVE